MTPPTPSQNGTKRRTKGFERTSGLLQGQIRRASESRGFAESRVLTHWAEIVGETVSNMAIPVKISYAQGGFGATLTILTHRGERANVAGRSAKDQRQGERVLRLCRDCPHKHHPNSPDRLCRGPGCFQTCTPDQTDGTPTPRLPPPRGKLLRRLPMTACVRRLRHLGKTFYPDRNDKEAVS